MSLKRTLRLVLLLPLVALGAPACDSPTGVCTLIGCDSGLAVQLNALPAGPFTVEILDAASDVTPRRQYTCAAGATPCDSRVFFDGLVVDETYVRITTDAGSLLHFVDALEYETVQPNGAGCDPICQSAQVTLAIPTAN